MKNYLFLILISFCINNLAVRAQQITIDLDSVHQAVRGFGGIHITSWQGTELNGDLREKAFGNGPGELGLSILRLQIDPDSNQFFRELPIARHAVANGALVFASPWNPPQDMLEPGTGTRILRYDMYDDYVKHLNRYNQFMADSGVPLYAVSVQNEPDYGDWTRWTAEQMSTFLAENAQDIQTRVIAPESFQFRRDYTDAILTNEQAAANVDIVGGHIYGGGLADYPLARELGKEVWMTEHYTSSDRSANLWPDALLVGSEINACMKANFNAYVWWYIRRFYGLITDDGAISRRGYVFSHFSKFVRPGALRVETVVTSASGIDATAFATDTSLAVVVINLSTAPVEIEVELLNGSIDTLSKFTTSADKFMLNEGGVSISSGLFTAVLDPESITTFTTDASAAGRFGNQAPVASAGEDVLLTDTDGNGSESLILSAATSSDADGTIVNYSWAYDGMQVSTDTTCQLDAAIGLHQIVLTVTDNDGARDADTINLTVKSIKNTNLWLEAECGSVGSTWLTVEDPAASGGQYVMAPLGTESLSGASADTADLISFPFHLAEDGTYKFWGRVITPSANDDSFWVRMNSSGTWTLWNSIPAGNSWHWDDLHDSNNGSLVVEFMLDTGNHVLQICYREDGALLDKLLLTNMGYVPEGPGDTAVNCPPEIPDQIGDEPILSRGLRVWPNPAGDCLNIDWIERFREATILNLEGQIVMSRTFPEAVDTAILQLDLDTGIYLLRVRNHAESKTVKLIIQ